jgi:hypothetical protein
VQVNNETINTMRKINYKPIFSNVYAISLRDKNERNRKIGLIELSFTNYASWSLKHTSAEALTPMLELIAQHHKIDLMQYGQFEYAFDLLKHSVSWN